MSQSRGAESAHKDHHTVVRQEKGTVPIRHLRQVKNADHKCMLETF